MLTPITEFFDGGIVTSRHPSLLQPGELQRADDCVYREKDPSIQRAPGRTAYNSVALSAGIKGLAHLSFDQNTDQLIAWPQGDATNSYLYKSDFTAITGSFNLVTGPGTIASCVTTNGSAVVTAPAGSFTNMPKGTKVVGAGIPIGTYIVTVDSAIQITLSANATASATVTLTFDAGVPFSFPDQGTETLDIIQWQSSYFVLSRNGPVAKLFWKQFPGDTTTETFIVRPAGLLPVTQAPTITVEAGAGWSSVLGNGFYWFLVTEILASDSSNTPEIEAGYVANEGRAVVVQITTFATQFIRVTFPTIRNDGANGTNRATHWGIYMSLIGPGQAAYADNTNMPSAATFRRIAKVAIEETSKDIKFSNDTQGSPKLATTTAALGGLAQFTNPGGFLNRGVGVASGTSGSGLTAGNILSGFGFVGTPPYDTYTITGIKINIVSSAAWSSQAGFYLWVDNNSTKSTNRIFGVSNRTTMYGQEFGSQFDTLGVAWLPADIPNIRVIIQKSYSASKQILNVDYIELTVYYSGATASTGAINLDGPPYQVVTYRSQVGTTVNDPSNYLIPTASTGDIFQGALVLNDVVNPSTIRYSLPNLPESFPKPYFMRFDSKKKDIITYIRRLGQILIVGMRDSVKRVNYLPTELDVDFQQGKAHEDIVTDNGIVGPLAACQFDLPGVGVVLGYASYNGLNYTDGITSRPMNLGINLPDLAKASALSNSILRVYPKEKWLIFYYCPFGATHTKNTRALIFHYGIDKVRNGYLPATGPISVSARSAAEANLSGVPYMLTGHQTSGIVYVEDSGVTQPTGYQVHDSTDTLVAAPISPLIKTRKIYPAGYNRDAREQSLYLLYDAIGTSYVIDSSLTSGSVTVTSANLFSNVVVGMSVIGIGLLPGTIVIAKASDSSITISSASFETGGVSLTFDDGTISFTVRGSGIRESIAILETTYLSSVTGDLLVVQPDNLKLGLELQIGKVVLPSGLSADLGQRMKLHTFTYIVADSGQEMNRTT